MSAVSELKKLEDHYVRELRKVRTALAAMGVGVSAELEKAKVVTKQRRRRTRPGVRGHLQELTLEALSESSNLTANEVAARLGAHNTAVMHALRTLCEKKRVVRSGVGSKNHPYRWALRYGVAELKAVAE